MVIRFSDRETPIESDNAVLPAKEIPTATPAAMELMLEESSACREISSAYMPSSWPPPSPSMNAFASTPIRLVASTPDPPYATPVAPPAKAAEPATTIASIL